VLAWYVTFYVASPAHNHTRLVLVLHWLLRSVLQVLLPVYGSSCLVAVLVHRRGHVVGRCVFKLYGLMPLLLRDHSKSLTLYRCGAAADACMPGFVRGQWGFCAQVV
jgi:hypothetical protein